MHRSASQWARKVTEGWANQNLYCLACPANQLNPHAANKAVEDFFCPSCGRRLQLKAKNGGIPATVSNSAFEKKRAAIAANRAPDYCFMGYDRDALLVNELLWVPGHFMTMSVISQRKPLRASAKRAGWVGSNIHLNLIPSAGKIALIKHGHILPRAQARAKFQQLSFMNQLDSEQRGWLADVLTALDSLEVRQGAQFTNDDIYGCEAVLADLHPNNHNIRPKIRQQLQVLTARGVVKRISPGRYERI